MCPSSSAGSSSGRESRNPGLPREANDRGDSGCGSAENVRSRRDRSSPNLPALRRGRTGANGRFSSPRMAYGALAREPTTLSAGSPEPPLRQARRQLSDAARTRALSENVRGRNAVGRPGGWARQVLNLRPLACEASALPLSYAPAVGEPSTWGPSGGSPSRLGKRDGGACPRRAAVIAEPRSSDAYQVSFLRIETHAYHHLAGGRNPRFLGSPRARIDARRKGKATGAGGAGRLPIGWCCVVLRSF